MFEIIKKEAFTVLVFKSDILSEKIWEDGFNFLKMKTNFPNLDCVISLKEIIIIEPNFNWQNLLSLQQLASHNNQTLFYCEMKANLLQQLYLWSNHDELNLTPTESEAWDMVQLAIIERELNEEE